MSRGKRSGSQQTGDRDEIWLPVSQPGESSADEQLTPWKPREQSITPADTFQATIEEFQKPVGRLARWHLRWQIELHARLHWLQAALRDERDRGAGFLWSPVVCGIGCIIYFILPREPLSGAFPVACALFVFLATRVAAGTFMRAVLLSLALMTFGTSLAQWRASSLAPHMLSRTMVAQIHGVVRKVERRANGRVRYTIVVGNQTDWGRGADNKELPHTVRLTARAGGPKIHVGEGISGRARLGPPSGPAFPGGYDFSFQSWFDGIGGSGFFLGAPKPVVNAKNTGAVAHFIEQARDGIASLIRTNLQDKTGGLAAALIVGDRSGIDEDTADSLRKSGLAHILAISGLHMALVSATVIFAIRGLLALFPSVALHYPIKKWASIAALAFATIYLMMSGASVSTQRAFLMVGVTLLAVIINRRALTMRNVAIAAFVLIIIAPEAILSPGFQMSFAAVAALIACYEALSERRLRRGFQPQGSGVVAFMRRFIVRDMGGLALTSLVAGIATGLFAAYHFQRVAPFGLLANLLAMPLVSFLVMPLAVVSTLAMPFGLEGGPLALMSMALYPVTEIASWVSGLEPSGHTGRISVAVVVLGTMALLAATLIHGRLRLLALPLLVVAGLAANQTQSPDILISESGQQLGIVQANGDISLMRPNAEKFVTNIWKTAFAPHMLSQQKKHKRGAAGAGFKCDDYGCSARPKGMTILHLKSTTTLFADCRIADVIVIPFRVPNACSSLPRAEQPLILDEIALRKSGSISIKIDERPPGATNIATQTTQSGQTTQQVQSKRHNRLIVTTSIRPQKRPWTAHRFGRSE